MNFSDAADARRRNRECITVDVKFVQGYKVNVCIYNE